MRYRRLGRSGLTVSVIGLGCNNLGGRLPADGTQAVVDAALDVGITLFDTADIYGEPHGNSEVELAKALGARRSEVVLATKFGMDMEGGNGPDFGARGSRRYVITAVEASLRRLRTDHIDLLQMHEPDAHTPIEETLSALDALTQSGKVRYVGSSNFAGWQVVEAEYVARRDGVSRFVSAQNRYSLLSREPEAELIPACERYGVGLIPYFPLESGLLTGKYRRGEQAPEGSRLARERYARILREAPWDVIDSLEGFAAQAGRSMLEVAVGGLAAEPGVSSVIVGAMTGDQVRANAAAGEWIPSADDLAELRRISAPTVD